MLWQDVIFRPLHAGISRFLISAVQQWDEAFCFKNCILDLASRWTLESISYVYRLESRYPWDCGLWKGDEIVSIHWNIWDAHRGLAHCS